MTAAVRPLPPGSTIGILGGGQLGRMLALAAARLGLKAHIYSDEAGPAFDVAAATTVGDYGDRAALERFARRIDVATYEFENVPVEAATYLEQIVPVRPGARALDVAQDRLNEKTLVRDLGIGTAKFAPVASLEDLHQALKGPLTPSCVLKTRRLGYDGKGQIRIAAPADAAAAWQSIGQRPAIVEALVHFRCEVSVIIARAADGTSAAFDVTENEHRDHILYRSLAPARISTKTASDARAIAAQIADKLDYVGVLAIEFFVVGEGSNERLLVNEMAPRVHNSGHWTIEGAETSQFEQHIRAVASWPLGASSRRAGVVEMINLIGEEAHDWQRLAAEPGLFLHLYGKREARKGRKMGHFTRILSA